MAGHSCVGDDRPVSINLLNAQFKNSELKASKGNTFLKTLICLHDAVFQIFHEKKIFDIFDILFLHFSHISWHEQPVDANKVTVPTLTGSCSFVCDVYLE